MPITSSQESLDLVRKISLTVSTCHEHHHILYDVAKEFPNDQEINYTEIGCFAGASACLMLQRPKTKVTSIDIGTPIPQETVLKNISQYNIHNNFYRYIKGNSHDKQIKQMVADSFIDILFIDGGHEYEDVITDFFMYSELLSLEGFVIFDDYSHLQGCPGVKPAVDFIVKKFKSFDILGTVDNVLGARGVYENNHIGNCFIMKRRIY
jgi:predicted O-methyltransferase YrrM